jgi:3-mercaptopyruvate sulfurtransferase SseA
LQSYYTTATATLASVLADHAKQVTLADSMLANLTPLQKYADELTADATALDQEQRKLEHAERKHRRSFLDGDPQEGVWGAVGVKTRDEKTLLAFWIFVTLAAAAATLVILHMYGVQNRRLVFGGAAGAAAVILGIAVSIVYRFA